MIIELDFMIYTTLKDYPLIFSSDRHKMNPMY